MTAPIGKINKLSYIF